MVASYGIDQLTRGLAAEAPEGEVSGRAAGGETARWT